MNALQVAKQKMMGIDQWGPEEYKFAFLVKKGLIHIPGGPIWDPKTHMRGNTNEQAIQRGFFNVRRWLGGAISPLDPHVQDPFPDLATTNNPRENAQSAPWHRLGIKDPNHSYKRSYYEGIGNDDIA